MKTISYGPFVRTPGLADAYRSSSRRESIFFFSREFVDAVQVLFHLFVANSYTLLTSPSRKSRSWADEDKGTVKIQ